MHAMLEIERRRIVLYMTPTTNQNNQVIFPDSSSAINDNSRLTFVVIRIVLYKIYQSHMFKRDATTMTSAANSFLLHFDLFQCAVFTDAHIQPSLKLPRASRRKARNLYSAHKHSVRVGCSSVECSSNVSVECSMSASSIEYSNVEHQAFQCRASAST
jgi:hypothetical protein